MLIWNIEQTRCLLSVKWVRYSLGFIVFLHLAICFSPAVNLTVRHRSQLQDCFNSGMFLWITFWSGTVQNTERTMLPEESWRVYCRFLHCIKRVQTKRTFICPTVGKFDNFVATVKYTRAAVEWECQKLAKRFCKFDAITFVSDSSKDWVSVTLCRSTDVLQESNNCLV